MNQEIFLIKSRFFIFLKKSEGKILFDIAPADNDRIKHILPVLYRPVSLLFLRKPSQFPAQVIVASVISDGMALRALRFVS